MKKIKNYFALFLVGVILFPLLNSCNNEDDIEAIFVGQKWYLGNFYTTTQWDDFNNNQPYFSASEELEARETINNNGRNCFYIYFNDDKHFTAQGLDNVFSGTYQANGKTNTLTFNITNGNAPNERGSIPERINTLFYQIIQECGFYYGSTIYLKLFPQDRRSFMQFSKTRLE